MKADGVTEDLTLRDLWGTRYIDIDGTMKVYPGIIDNDKKFYRNSKGELVVADVLPSNETFTELTRVSGFNTLSYLYTTTLPMSARYVTLDLSKFGNHAADHASVVYNNAYYHTDAANEAAAAAGTPIDPIDPVPDAALDARVNVPLKSGERVSYIFVTVHPDLGDPATLTKDDASYKQNATTYVIRVKRLNNEAFQNIWVTDTEYKDDTVNNRPSHYEQMWLMRDTTKPKQEYNDVRGKYAGADDDTLADWIDITWLADGTDNKYDDKNNLISSMPATKGEQLHNIYDNDLTHGYTDYGAMVSTLDTYILLNAEAFGTAVDGTNEDYYIIIEEYGVNDPQHLDSRTYNGGTSRGRVTDAKFRLDPSKDEQIFQFTIVNEKTGTMGVYFLHVYREHTEELKVQTKLVGTIQTAATRVPVADHEKGDPKIDPTGDGYKNDFEAQISVYRKTDLLRYYQGVDPDHPQSDQNPSAIPMPYPTLAEGWYSVDEAVKALGITVTDLDGDGDLTYDERFDALLRYTDSNNLSPLIKVNVLNSLTGTELTDTLTGQYSIDLSGQAPGAYMVVFHRAGSLDYVMDNVLVYPTYAKAQYDFGNVTLRAGDLNGDGIIDEDDLEMFNKYKTAVDGIYRELAGRMAVNYVSVDNASSLTTNYTMDQNFNVSELNNLKLYYTDPDTGNRALIEAGAQIGTKAYANSDVTFYLSRSGNITSINGKVDSDLYGGKKDVVVDLSSGYAFDGATGSADDLGIYYLYGVFEFYDDQMQSTDAVDVVYRIAAINVTESATPPSHASAPIRHSSSVSRPVVPEPAEPSEPTLDVETGSTEPAESTGPVESVETVEPVETVETTVETTVTETVPVEPTVEQAETAEPETAPAEEPAGIMTADLMEIELEPADDEPVFELPVLDDEPVAEVPVIDDEPAPDDEPVAEEPVVDDEPVTEDPVTDDDEQTEIPPDIEEPGDVVVLPDEPVMDEPVIDQPATDDEQPEIPPVLEDLGDLVTLPDQPAEEPIVLDDLAQLAQYLMENGIAMDSAEAEALMLEMALASANADLPGRLDLDGNGILTNADLGYIPGHWRQTTYLSCRRDNMYSRYQAILEPWSNP